VEESQGVQNPTLTLERVCAHRNETRQLVFARDAMDLLPPYPSTAYEATEAGLLILAETEFAMSQPVQLLQQVYGGDIAFSEPRVRYRTGRTLEEPYMGLRVMAPPDCVGAVVDDLRRRGATSLTKVSSRHTCEVRAIAPLGMLLGYGRELSILTRGRAQCTMWFRCYAPVDSADAAAQPGVAEREEPRPARRGSPRRRRRQVSNRRRVRFDERAFASHNLS